ncbi:MAG TPA: carbohydrate-binding protein, partial [Polyangiaceae bacterium]|nr:carbohydrate-binding protein [Polyangiaceae bacterium]
MQIKDSRIAPETTHTNARPRLLLRRAGALLLLGGVGTLVGCNTTDGRVKLEPWEARDEADSTATVSQGITITGTLFEDQFDTLSATTGSPVGSGKKWYIQQNFKPNNEIQEYGRKVCPDNYDPPGNNTNLGTANSATGVEDDYNNWSFCNVNDVDKGASNALWLRAHNDGAGKIHSGRLNSKRLMEFGPTSSYGVKATVRIRKYSSTNTQGGGWWPAVWFLQRDIAEAPIIGDGDNAPWPCERAHEIDLYEQGSLGGWGQAWGPNHNKSSMHYRNGYCVPQSVENTLGSEIFNDSIANNDYHTYSMELETTKARFYYDGVQYGPEHNIQGLKFETPLFWIINGAAGGALGGTVNWGAFSGDDKSVLIDYIKVESFNWSTALPRINIANTTDPNSATKLEAETNHAQSGMTAENCSEGGQNMGWIDSLPDGTGDWVQWDINVPAEADWKLEQRNAINNGGAAAGFRVRVDGTQVASGNLPNTGGWQTWATNSTNSFHLTAGNHTIQWQATTAGQNLNWVRLVKASAASCTDYVKNQGETGIDCGGPCGACPTCSNGVQDSFDPMNWFETGVDCGGPCTACSGPGAGVGSKLQAESAAGYTGTQIET